MPKLSALSRDSLPNPKTSEDNPYVRKIARRSAISGVISRSETMTRAAIADPRLDVGGIVQSPGRSRRRVHRDEMCKRGEGRKSVRPSFPGFLIDSHAAYRDSTAAMDAARSAFSHGDLSTAERLCAEVLASARRMGGLGLSSLRPRCCGIAQTPRSCALTGRSRWFR